MTDYLDVKQWPLERLVAEVIRLSETVKTKDLIISDLEKDYKVVRDNVLKLSAENRHLREALKEISNPNNWCRGTELARIALDAEGDTP